MLHVRRRCIIVKWNAVHLIYLNYVVIFLKSQGAKIIIYKEIQLKAKLSY